jgi:hypothetical protein
VNFRQLGDYFLWAFLEIFRSSANLLTTFSQSICSVFILTKNGLGYILGDFFTNSSGHLDYFPPFLRGEEV